MIYLDFAASTPLLASVKKVLFDSYEQEYSNPSSAHLLGRKAAEKIEDVRSLIANSIGSYKSEIIFTSGASEANNLAIKGYVLANIHKGKHIITSTIEHKCILAICHFLEKEHNFEVTYVPPEPNGIINAMDVINSMREDTILVSIMHINNEIGSIQPIKKIGEACFQRNIKFHVDAAQAYKKIPINVDDLNIDMLSISAHKIYGPKGIGAVYLRDLRETKLQPLIHGAGQEKNLRGGTLPTSLILGFGAAIQDKTIENSIQSITSINDSLRKKIIQLGGIINSPSKNFIPHILNIQLPNLKSNQFVFNSTFLCSQGSACSALNIEPSYVLTQLGLNSEEANSSIRVSIDHNVNEIIINKFIKEIIKSTV